MLLLIVSVKRVKSASRVVKKYETITNRLTKRLRISMARLLVIVVTCQPCILFIADCFISYINRILSSIMRQLIRRMVSYSRQFSDGLIDEIKCN